MRPRQGAFRIVGPGGQEIESLDDWLKYAPPKKREKHWKPGRSAMETARAWLDGGRGATFPREIIELLDSHDSTRAFRPELAIPEWVTRLDNYVGEHRNHDLIAVGKAAGGNTLVAFEAKADESFGNHSVDGYLKLCAPKERERPAKVKAAVALGRRPPGRSNAPARIKQLCAAILGPPLSPADAVSTVALTLRYQLVTALAGALIEARTRGCRRCWWCTSSSRILSLPAASTVPTR